MLFCINFDFFGVIIKLGKKMEFLMLKKFGFLETCVVESLRGSKNNGWNMIVVNNGKG